MRSLAPTLASVVSLLALAACQREPAPVAPVIAPPVTETPAAAAAIEGWQTETADYALLGMTLPNFTASLHGGGTVTQDTLRDRWTIIGFWNSASDDSVGDAHYIQALNSAAGQDPDLDFLSIHTISDPLRANSPNATDALTAWFTAQGGPWPTALDTDGKVAASFMITKVPVYLLVGPDLTIEGYRGALSTTPDDGIKSVIRGVAQIRKQIAAPG